MRAGIAQCALAALQQATGPVIAVGELTAADDVTVEDVAQLVEDSGERVLLVVDDLHELAETPSMPAFERLLLAAPPNLHIALGTRTWPSINLARLELPQPVLIVGDDLRFRSWEVEGLFRDFYSEPLRPDDAAALARRTDGWAAGLQLFHLATLGRERDARSDAISSLTGRARYAQAYLSAQVLEGLPDGLREFVRRTSVFDVLTGARCDRLLETDTSQRTLEELERRQALTTSDDDGTTFRYHEVFRRHLATALLEEIGDAGMRAWFARAADILEEEGAIVEALRARCRGADWTGVQRLAHRGGPADRGGAGLGVGRAVAAVADPGRPVGGPGRGPAPARGRPARGGRTGRPARRRAVRRPGRHRVVPVGGAHRRDVAARAAPGRPDLGRPAALGDPAGAGRAVHAGRRARHLARRTGQRAGDAAGR